MLSKLYRFFKEWRRAYEWSLLSDEDKLFCRVMGNLDSEGRPLQKDLTK